MNGLPETGVVDEQTWRKLLGEEYDKLEPPAEVSGVSSKVAVLPLIRQCCSAFIPQFALLGIAA